MMEKGLGRYELVKVFDGFKVFYDPFQMVTVPLLQTRTNRDCKKTKTNKQTNKALVSYPLEKSYACKENEQKDAPDIGVPQLRSNLGASCGFSLGTISQSSPKTKKKLVF